MPTYTVARPNFRHDGEEYSEGDSVEIPESQATPLLGLGAIEGAEEDEDAPEPSDDLKELVGTRPANALAKAGLTTIEEALAYEGDLTDLDGVGDQTAEDLADFAA